MQSEFNRDGRYQITSEDQADGVVVGDITKYILEPLSYDSNHVPTEYKMWILVDVKFYDKVKNLTLWEEPNMEAIQVYAASTLQGGITEEQARELAYDQLSRDITKRVIEGFGSVTGMSLRAISREAPPNQQAPALPSKPLNPNPY